MVEIMITPDAGEHSTNTGDLLRDLASWFADEDDLRGRVRLADGEPVPDTLGAVVDTLVATITPAAATALTTVLVTWLRHRRGKVSVTVQAADGKRVEVSTEGVAGLSAAEVRALADDLASRIT